MTSEDWIRQPSVHPENRAWAEAAEQALITLVETLVLILGRTAAARRPVMRELLNSLVHSCYKASLGCLLVWVEL